ncbi:winged helix-turn-helix domain-containing tetratricopeptide repeat protein [Aromatoleum petrolei]|uniref:CadC-family transcriptional regulator n=1 Tax=Aromatoleum petrolei TaxID=76116 RepID=A0ABX1MV85_9RHOO|nr:winged helix-turn-helix domain-containing protein [Aromatoleum petrolei]NMF89007.1 CadC-family transcriptional regulator [Aromatoleum petrolei]QTQ34367.1 Putative transcriptional regulator, tetratricopeptide repeat-containing [Aromatoleum petrolei]
MLLVFDDCVLDLDRRELSRASGIVATAPKVFDLLVYLAERRERVVSRDDLIDAVWSGRVVSESTLASHINAVRKAVGDDGQQQRVIRTVARKGFRFVAEVREIASLEGAAAPGAESAGSVEVPASAPALPAKPSIAVLPFANLSGDPEQEYLADGVVEDIIAALSQNRWLFVVARNSSFTYKNRAMDVKQVGRELGVRYVLEGSWRKADNRVRITGQLIDATTGAHHWAGRFEGVLGDIFELQDQITETVVGAIAPQLERAEIERARHKPTDSLDAYDYYLRGMARLHHGTKEAIDQALTLFLKAIEFDPDFASAYAMAAWCHCWRKINGWMSDHPQEVAEGIRLARRAVELGKGDAVALTRSAHALGHLADDLPGGIALLDRALVLNPNLAAAWFLGAFLRLWHGETEEAVEHFAHAMRLSPLDPELYRMQAGLAAAHLFMGHFDTASSWAEKALRELPSLLLAAATLAASHALAGRAAQAQHAMDNLRQLDPRLRLSSLADWLPIRRRENVITLVDGLRRAGLRE